MSRNKRSATLALLERYPKRYRAKREKLVRDLEAVAKAFRESSFMQLPDEYREACRNWPDSALDTMTPGDAEQVIASVMGAQRRRGGKSAANVAKTRAAAWQEECAKAARELLQHGRSPRELAGILSKRFHVTPRQVRNALKLQGVTQKNGN